MSSNEYCVIREAPFRMFSRVVSTSDCKFKLSKSTQNFSVENSREFDFLRKIIIILIIISKINYNKIFLFSFKD